MSAELQAQIKMSSFSLPPHFRYPNTNIIKGFKTQLREAEFCRADVGKGQAKAIELLLKKKKNSFVEMYKGTTQTGGIGGNVGSKLQVLEI